MPSMFKEEKNEEFLFLEYLDANNFYGWAISQKLHVNGFTFVRKVSKIDEDFKKKQKL